MGIEKTKKSAFKHIESEIYAYHETRKEIIRLRNDILYSTGGDDENVGGGRSNLPGDPTYKRVAALMSHRRLQHLEKIADVIEVVYNKQPEHKKKLINLVYWTTPQTLTWDGIAQKLHISRRQAIVWRNDIVGVIGEALGW